MNRAEMNAFWGLLAGLRPMNKEYLQSNEVRRAWALAMEPYPFAAAKEALLACCREVGYWPLVSEVVSRIPAGQRPPPPPAQGEDARARRMKRDLELLKREASRKRPPDPWTERKD